MSSHFGNRCLSVAIILVLMFLGVARAISSPSDLSCEDTGKVYAQKVGTSESVPTLPVTNRRGPVCSKEVHATHGVSCCTEEMEKGFVRVSTDYVHKLIETSNAELTNTIRQNLDTVLEHIGTSINRAFNATSDTLTRLYRIPVDAHRSALSRLFRNFTSFMEGNNLIALDDSINDFFASLFPSVYHHVLTRPQQPTASGGGGTGSGGADNKPDMDEFNKCLADFHDEILPFGASTAAFAKRVHYAFKRAQAVPKTFLTMLNAIRVVDSVDINYGRCHHAFARIHYCPMCAGQTTVKPCRGFCLNVMRGCLPNIMELSPAWDSLVDTFKNHQKGLLYKNNVQEVMAYFNGNVSEALMTAMTEIPRIYTDVAVRCQEFANPSLTGSDILDQPANLPEAPNMLPSLPNGPVGSLHHVMVRSIKQLASSKGFLARLADGLCRREDLFDQEMRSETCWNGTAVGRYTYGVPEANMVIQAQQNREVIVSVLPKPRLREVKDTLLLMKKNLSFLSNQELMVGDQSYGSGDFEANDPITDDEDLAGYFSGSGSGSNEEEEPTDEVPGRTTPTKKPGVISTPEVQKPREDKDDENGSLPGSSASLTFLLGCGLLWWTLVAMTTTSLS